MGESVDGNAEFKFANSCRNAVKDNKRKMLRRKENRKGQTPSLEPGSKLKSTGKKKRIVIPGSEEAGPKSSGFEVPKPLGNLLPDVLRQD